MSLLTEANASEPVEPALQFDKAAATQRLRDRIDAAIAQQIDNYSPDKIVASIVADLRKSQQEVIWKILGMENSWGEWRIDHCNGRTSPLSSLLAERCQPMLADAAVEIGREVVAEMVVDPAARKKLKDAFRKELQTYLDRTLKEAARSRAYTIATEALNTIVAEVKAEAGL